MSSPSTRLPVLVQTSGAHFGRHRAEQMSAFVETDARGRTPAMPRRQSLGLGRQDDRNAREASARDEAFAAPTRRGFPTIAIR